jgi:tetratricopeptide (TPR) repeat protein
MLVIGVIFVHTIVSTMDADDFLDEDVTSNVQRYEKMLRNKTQDYFDAETLESIIEFYINKDKLKAALEVIYYGENLYSYYISFGVKKAEVFVMMGKFEDAIAEIERLELYEPFNAELSLLKGETYLNMEEVREAEECFEKALMHTDERIDTLFEIAYVYEDCDLYEKAIYYFDIIIKENKDNEQAYYEIANCYDVIGRYDLCIEYYDKLINIDPFSTNAWYNLGVIYTKMEQYEKSVDAFDYCLAIDDDFVAARFNKANALVELDRFEDAIEEYILTIDKEGPDSITYCNLAGCYERLNENVLAREYYKKATRINPNIAEAWFGVGLTYEKEGFMKDAISYFKRAALLEQDNPEYLLVLAEAEYRSGNPAEAKDLYKRLIESDPTMMEAWLDWSFIEFMEEDPELGIGLICEALKIDYDCHQYHYRLVSYLYATGKTKEALEHLDIALMINFEDHFLLFELTPALQNVKEILTAIELNRP